MDVGLVIAAIDLVVGVVVAALTLVAARRLRGGTLAWVAYALFAAGLLFVAHAAVEVLGFGEELYAETALVATLVLAFAVVIVNITLSVLGVRR
ncbi:MAG: hypothetical protein HY681_09750 [Chloroflexi bacterium]|nr:hypothetical protein [Chloroflexota bacterium]